MKITDLNGMIKLEADDRKVLTTIEPSSLRVKLLYVNKDNINNFIEVNEHPEIILPEEPSLDESLEELDGLTLVEAYHRLIGPALCFLLLIIYFHLLICDKLQPMLTRLILLKIHPKMVLLEVLFQGAH